MDYVRNKNALQESISLQFNQPTDSSNLIKSTFWTARIAISRISYTEKVDFLKYFGINIEIEKDHSGKKYFKKTRLFREGSVPVWIRLVLWSL